MYKLSEVARATDISARTLTDWLSRKLVDVPAHGSGTHRRFSKDDTTRIALIADLTKVGVSVSDAAKAAASFCDEAGADRDASELFPSGKTVLLIDADGARCINVDASREQFESAMKTVYAPERTVVMVVINHVVARVDAALDGNGKPMAPAAAIFRHGRQMAIN